MKVLLVKDHPPLGFEGEVVEIKPGHAIKSLIPKKIAVYNFPGVRKRLYPNISDDELRLKKLRYLEFTRFEQKIQKIHIEIIKTSSFANPTMFKEPLNGKEVAKEI